MIAVNYWAILVCGIVSMVVGFIWYGPLFGKTWGRVIGSDKMSDAECKEAASKAGPLYFVQFVLTLFQAFVVAYFIKLIPTVGALDITIWMFAGIVLPLVAGGSMWNNESKKNAWTRFGLQAGYQLIMFVVFGLILGMWL